MRRSQRLAPLVAVTATAWGANQFAPLVVMYQQRSGIDEAATQLMFVIYAVSLVPGLFLGGPLSDRYGRRLVVLLALCASITASLTLMLGSLEITMLFVGRLIAGIASGAGFSAGTAWIKETSPAGRGASRAMIAMTAGFGLGPLGAGMLAATAPRPEVLVYVPHLVVTVGAVVLVLRTPSPPVSVRSVIATEVLGVPRAPALGNTILGDRRFRRIVMPLAPWVFLTAAVSLAVLPAAVVTGTGGLVITALITSVTALAGIGIPLVLRPLLKQLRTQIVVTFVFAVGGFVVAAWAVADRSLVALVLAAVLLGCGYGVCQTTGLGETVALAPAGQLGRSTAIYQTLTYVGYVSPLPIVLLTAWFSLSSIMLAIAGLGVITAIMLLLQLRGLGAWNPRDLPKP